MNSNCKFSAGDTVVINNEINIVSSIDEFGMYFETGDEEKFPGFINFNWIKNCKNYPDENNEPVYFIILKMR